MVLALLLALNLADAVPARWPAADPKTLDLLADTPINTLLLDQAPANAAFAEAAASRGISVMAVVRPGADVAEAARRAAGAKLAGIVLEGEFPPAAANAVRGAGLAVVELPPRSAIRFDAVSPVAGTTQGVWPGIRAQAKAAATGGPWIETIDRPIGAEDELRAAVEQAAKSIGASGPLCSPETIHHVHVRGRVNRLDGGDDIQLGQPLQVVGVDALDVLDAVTDCGLRIADYSPRSAAERDCGFVIRHSLIR